MFNDVGVIAREPPARPTAPSSPASRCSSPAASAPTRTRRRRSRSSPRREDLLPTIEAMPAHVRPLRQPRQQAARPHEVARRHDGHRRAARAHLQGAQVPAARRPPTRAASPRSSQRARRRAGRHGHAPIAPTVGTDGRPGASCSRPIPYERWEVANVVRGRANGTVSAYAYCRLGDITTDQFRGLAAIQRDFDVDVRITNRQNFVLRGLTEDAAPRLYDRLAEHRHGRAGRRARPRRRRLPGADTCNLAVTQSRGLAADIGDALEEAGLAEVGGVRINISGCTNSCGQHHISDIGFFGLERRAHGRAAPGYQMLLGGHVGDMEIEFGEKATKLPAKTRVRSGRAGRRAVRRRARRRARRSRRGSPAPAAPPASATTLEGPRRVPHARRRPRLLRRLRRDRARTSPKSATSECAT